MGIGLRRFILFVWTTSVFWVNTGGWRVDELSGLVFITGFALFRFCDKLTASVPAT